MVSIRKVEAVLAALNDGDDAGIHTRLKYLNLNKFPPGLRVGKAKRADYGLEELLAYALWFSLSRACFPPATATALVVDFWPEWVRLFLADAKKDLPDIKLDRHLRVETMAVIVGSALTPAARPDGDEAGSARSWDIGTAARANVADRLAGGSAASVVIDMAATRRGLFAALESGEAAVPWGWNLEQTATIAEDEGWAEPADSTKASKIVAIRPKPAIPSRGERLGERDYFFARAMELIGAAKDPAAVRWPGRRRERLSDYLLRPSPREEWKRWVEVDESGVPFVWGMAALVSSVWPDDAPIPETTRVSASNRIADGDVSRLAEKLRATAKRARAYEPV